MLCLDITNIWTTASCYKHAVRHVQEGVAAERLAEGLARLGYALEPGEAARLLEAVARDGDESVPKAKFLASQIDWAAYQMDFRCLSVHAHHL